MLLNILTRVFYGSNQSSLWMLPWLLYAIELQDNLIILCLSRCEEEFTSLVDIQGRKQSATEEAGLPSTSTYLYCSVLRQEGDVWGTCWGNLLGHCMLSPHSSDCLYSPPKQKVPVLNFHCGFYCQVLMELKMVAWFGCFHWSPLRNVSTNGS